MNAQELRQACIEVIGDDVSIHIGADGMFIDHGPIVEAVIRTVLEAVAGPVGIWELNARSREEEFAYTAVRSFIRSLLPSTDSESKDA